MRPPRSCWPGLATPLVLSVHSVISFDFAVARAARLAHHHLPALLRRRRHVLRLRHGHHAGGADPQAFYHLEDMITIRHIDNMAKVMLTTGLIVAYGYSMEVFMAWYSASHWEFFMMWNRMFGPMGWSYWVLITCNIAMPQLMWLRSTRVSPMRMFLLSSS
jgi:hypothetical protein